MTTVAANSQKVNPMTDQQSQQGLVPARVVQGTVLESPDQYRSYVAEARSRGAHVLSPVTDIGSLPANWAIVPSAVYLSPNPDEGDVYRDNLFCRGDEVAPTKMGLRKIASAAGIGWKVVREDSGHVPNYWAMKCTIEFRGHDGLPKQREASYEWDLRDGSPRIAGMSPKELNRARLNGYRRCEAGAINAAIREYGIKQKYSAKDLTRPFVVFNLVFQPETDEQKNMLAQAALTGTTMLYGGTAQLPAAEAKVVDKFEPGDKGPAEVPFEDEPEDDDDWAEVSVEVVTRSQDTEDYFIKIAGGRKLHTSNAPTAVFCRDAGKANEKILIRVDADELLEAKAAKKPAAAGSKY